VQAPVGPHRSGRRARLQVSSTSRHSTADPSGCINDVPCAVNTTDAAVAAADEVANGFPQSVIDAELDRVLASKAFAQSRRQQQLLRYLVRSAAIGPRAVLKETVVAVEVFGRALDRFDPRADNIVRVEARRLRQRLARHYADEGRHARLRIELPVGSYVPLLHRHEPPPAPTATRAARDLAERGEHFLRLGDEASIRKALERFDAALREAPGYAAAHKGAARARMALVCAWHEPSVPWIDEAQASLQRALALDPADAEAVVTMGVLHHRHRHDWPTAQAWLNRAVDMAPQSPLARAGRGFYLTVAGLSDAAEADLRLARQLDPHYSNARLLMAKLRVAQRRWDDADKELDALLDIAPQHFSALMTRADICRFRRQPAEAVALYRAVREHLPAHAAPLLGEAQAFAMRGAHRECDAAMALAHQLAGRPLPAYSVAMVRMYAGRHDEALALLQDSAAALDPAFIFANIEPAFDALRDDARFITMLRGARAQLA
jgi:tetratricopeptide (TPR) repeat protein